MVLAQQLSWEQRPGERKKRWVTSSPTQTLPMSCSGTTFSPLDGCKGLLTLDPQDLDKSKETGLLPQQAGENKSQA